MANFFDTNINAVQTEYALVQRGLKINTAFLRSIGIYPVAYPYPPHNESLYVLEPFGDPHPKADDPQSYVQDFTVVALPAETAKANLKRYVAERRWQTETGGVTLPDGTRLPTDVEARPRFGTALSGCPADGTVSVKLDGEFHTLTHAEMTALVTAIATHVQVCFDHERDLHELIDAAETIADLEALDVTTGWPGSGE